MGFRVNKRARRGGSANCVEKLSTLPQKIAEGTHARCYREDPGASADTFYLSRRRAQLADTALCVQLRGTRPTGNICARDE